MPGHTVGAVSSRVCSQEQKKVDTGGPRSQMEKGDREGGERTMDMEGGRGRGKVTASYRIARCLSSGVHYSASRNEKLCMARVVRTKGASPGSAVWAEGDCVWTTQQAVQRDTDHRHHVTVTPWFRVRGEGRDCGGQYNSHKSRTSRHCTK